MVLLQKAQGEIVQDSYFLLQVEDLLWRWTYPLQLDYQCILQALYFINNVQTIVLKRQNISVLEINIFTTKLLQMPYRGGMIAIRGRIIYDLALYKLTSPLPYLHKEMIRPYPSDNSMMPRGAGHKTTWTPAATPSFHGWPQSLKLDMAPQITRPYDLCGNRCLLGDDVGRRSCCGGKQHCTGHHRT